MDQAEDREGAPGERLVRDLSSYAFSPLRDGDVTLYRGSGQGLLPILLVAAEGSSLACLKRLEHEYTLTAELDAAWATLPIQLSRHRNRSALVLEDPGGDPLHRLLGQPLGITQFLRIGISLAPAPSGACLFFSRTTSPGSRRRQGLAAATSR
jgi:hypothetical protein